MFFSKNTIATIALLLSVTLQAEAHASIAPMLGLGRKPVRNDSQRPTDNKPCGNFDVAKSFDSTETIAVKSDHTFSALITNFNAGVDGSRQITEARFDPTGTGKNFRDMKILINGKRSPTENSASEKLFFQLLGDCKGGSSKRKCLVSLKTAGGFGNCVVVEQNKPNSNPKRLYKARAPYPGTLADGSIVRTTVVDGQTEVVAVGPNTSLSADQAEASSAVTAIGATSSFVAPSASVTGINSEATPVSTTDTASITGADSSLDATSATAAAVSTVTVTKTVSIKARSLPTFARDY